MDPEAGEGATSEDLLASFLTARSEGNKHFAIQYYWYLRVEAHTEPASSPGVFRRTLSTFLEKVPWDLEQEASCGCAGGG